MLRSRTPSEHHLQKTIHSLKECFPIHIKMDTKKAFPSSSLDIYPKNNSYPKRNHCVNPGPIFPPTLMIYPLFPAQRATDRPKKKCVQNSCNENPSRHNQPIRRPRDNINVRGIQIAGKKMFTYKFELRLASRWFPWRWGRHYISRIEEGGDSKRVFVA